MADDSNVEVVNLAPHVSANKEVTISQLIGAQLRMNNFPLEVVLIVHTLMELADVDPATIVNMRDYEAILTRNAQNAGMPVQIVRREVPQPKAGETNGH